MIRQFESKLSAQPPDLFLLRSAQIPMLFCNPTSPTRWSVLRLVSSELVWLFVFILAFRSDGFSALLLICVAGALRPPPVKEADGNQHLGVAISLLIAIPLFAFFRGSEAAHQFMRSTPGLILVIALWTASLIADLPFYRALFQARASIAAPRPSQTSIDAEQPGAESTGK